MKDDRIKLFTAIVYFKFKSHIIYITPTLAHLRAFTSFIIFNLVDSTLNIDIVYAQKNVINLLISIVQRDLKSHHTYPK